MMINTEFDIGQSVWLIYFDGHQWLISKDTLKRHSSDALTITEIRITGEGVKYFTKEFSDNILDDNNFFKSEELANDACYERNEEMLS